MEITEVTLTNGRKVPDVLLATTLLCADKLAEDPMNVIAFVELIEMANNPAHKPFGNTGRIIEGFGLTQGGVMHDAVRAIIRAAYEINGFDAVKKNPVAV